MKPEMLWYIEAVPRSSASQWQGTIFGQEGQRWEHQKAVA